MSQNNEEIIIVINSDLNRNEDNNIDLDQNENN